MRESVTGNLRRSFAIAGAAVVSPLLILFLCNALWGYMPLSRDVAKVPYYVLATNTMRDLEVSVLRAALQVRTHMQGAEQQDLVQGTSVHAAAIRVRNLKRAFAEVERNFDRLPTVLGEWPTLNDKVHSIHDRWNVVRLQAASLVRIAPDEFVSVPAPLRLATIDFDPVAVSPVGRLARSFDSNVAMLTGDIETMIDVLSTDVKARLLEGQVTNERVFGLTFTLGMMAIIFIMYVNLRLARYVVDPVNGIVEAITRFRRGDYAARTGIARKDEIGALADAFNEMAENIERTHADLSQLTERDPLTGMLNRRGFDPRLELHLRKAESAGHEMAIIMVDVDHFKKINDTYGHAVGDQVLVALADTIRNCLRAGDFSARLGGEEFVICLPGQGKATGASVAERLREAVARMALFDNEGVAFSVTISAGVSTFPECGRSQGEILARGDEALYVAKSYGRNRVELAKQDRKWRKSA